LRNSKKKKPDVLPSKKGFVSKNGCSGDEDDNYDEYSAKDGKNLRYKFIHSSMALQPFVGP
jgi:hypothetical protein